MKDAEGEHRRRLSLGPVLTPFVWLWGVAVLLGTITAPVTLVRQFGWRVLPLLPLPMALFLLWGYGCLTLKIVWAGERELQVRGFFGRIAVPYSQIADVRHRWGIGAGAVIRVLFKQPTRLGRKIRYLSRHGFSSLFPLVHPDVVFLREKMAQTAGQAERE